MKAEPIPVLFEITGSFASYNTIANQPTRCPWNPELLASRFGNCQSGHGEGQDGRQRGEQIGGFAVPAAFPRSVSCETGACGQRDHRLD